MRKAIVNGYTTVNNITVSYNGKGPEGAPVIIFIHGFPLNKSMWNKQLNALEKEWRVIAYDIRGHGNSAAGDEDFSIELFVNDLLGFMDALEVDKAVLCGLSMGGYIAMHAVENFPERFIALVLCDTQCAADTPGGKGKRMMAIENIRKSGVEKYADGSLESLFAVESFKTKVAEIAAVKQMIVKTPEQSLINTLLALVARGETCSKLPEIGIPVLILVGEQDQITPPETAEFMHQKIKGSLLGIIPHAGHLSNLENPDLFSEQLIKFVASINTAN